MKYALPALSSIILAASPSFAASWQTNVNYGGGAQPTMHLYVPDKVDATPAIVLAIHYCGYGANDVHGWFQSAADKHGFIIIAPDNGPGDCWDSAPGRTGEKAAIVKMVEYVIQEHNGDETRVFSAGASSGACMTNTLMASYPDVFAGGSVLAGVPAGGWSGGASCGVCSQNASDKTPAAWGDIVRSAFSFSGTRPRLQLWHAQNDPTLRYGWFTEEVDQWTNVLGLESATPTDESYSGPNGTAWARKSYKDSSGAVVLQANSNSGLASGNAHYLPDKLSFDEVVKFFGLDQDPTGNGGTGGTGGTDTSAGGTSAKTAIAAGGTSAKTSSGSSTGGKAISSSSKPTSSAGGRTSSKPPTSKAAAGGTSGSDTGESTGGADSSDPGEEGGSDSQSTSGGSKSTSKTSATKGGSKSSTKTESTTDSTSDSSNPGFTPTTGTIDPGAGDSGCGIVGANGRSRGMAALLSILAGLALVSGRRRRN